MEMTTSRSGVSVHRMMHYVTGEPVPVCDDPSAELPLPPYARILGGDKVSVCFA